MSYYDNAQADINLKNNKCLGQGLLNIRLYKFIQSCRFYSLI
jgi:hypothetical protein